MARYSVKEAESEVSIELTDLRGQRDQLMGALGECQAGQCSCPTDEYQKLASMDIDEREGVIRIRLEPKPGERLDVSEITDCLDYTTAKATNPPPGV